MHGLDRVLEVVGELRRRLIRIALVLGPMLGFLVTFQIRTTTVVLAGHRLWLAYPYPNIFYNVTAQLFRLLVAYMLPPGVTLLNVGVGDSIVAQFEIAILLTLVVGMPWIIHEVGAFLVPALRRNERELLRRIGIPATFLFAVGFSAGLFLLTPLTFRFLFDYVRAMGLAPVLGVQDFVTFTLLYSLAFGVVFELPVFIYTLTRLGLVPAASWRQHWRAAVIGALFFGMVVTPDNSGITMLLIATPMVGLYLGGTWFAARWEARRARTLAPIGAG
ncbi:MAG: twin-arginine translocase subunit TatC [Thermoplasmata archaeon]|nr:twin-arginine translocase subunit TatC [Thermoplasmata archaeon]MCI4338660.1 twin-arginine translocase subunit TatC [Thermoplasmata archaeon]MCI4341863.1 twin-arginine translocase subunit TatC [Thermoplasmata archaeon]